MGWWLGKVLWPLHTLATSTRVKQEKRYQPLCERNGHCTRMVGPHMSISQYCVFKISKGSMPVKDVYPKKSVATPLRTPRPPSPHRLDP